METLLSWVFHVLPWLLIAIAFLFKVSTTQQRGKPKTPPGPRPWPIIGNLNLLGSTPHKSLHSLSQKYGDLMLLKFGSKPVLVASSPETAKLFLKTHDAVFASRPPTAAAEYTFNRSDVVFAPHGPFWRHARKILLSEVFNLKKLDSFEHIRVEERRAFISGLYSAAICKKPVLLRDHLVRFTLSTITRVVTGHKYYNNESELRKPDGYSIPFKKLQEFLDDWFLLGGLINLGDWIPWLSCFDLQGYVKKMKAFRDEYSKFLDYVIEDHRAIMKAADNNFVPKDIVDVFLQIADDPTLDAQDALTRDRLRGLIHDMLAGGTDTTATSLEWVFQELFRKPWIIEKAKEELDRVIGRERWVEEKDLSQLPYIEAIVKETLRLHPVATLLPPHYSMEDCKVGGYEVPKGTVVFINVWSIGRDSKYWDKANEFLPERFLERDIDITGQDFGVLTFGSGRRKCPGYSLGLKVIRTTLANLLHGFNWKLAGDMRPEDISLEEIYGLTTHPKSPLSFIVEPRLPTHLY
nr:cytochrome P450 71A1-like [Ipomoea batatas]